MSGFYPDGVTQSSFDAYWNDKLDDPEEGDEEERCGHGMPLCELCEDCEDEEWEKEPTEDTIMD